MVVFDYHARVFLQRSGKFLVERVYFAYDDHDDTLGY